MATIGYDNIVDVLLSLQDPNTWWATSNVPWVSSPKINWATSIYNVEVEWWLWIAGWSTDVKWTPWTWSISWSSGKIYLPDWTEISISSGSATVSSPTYIYVDTESWTVSYSTHWYDAVGENKIMICAAFPNTNKNVTFKAFGCGDQSSLVTGSDIAANTIVASNIASWTITANEIHSNTITSSEIASGAITTSKLNSWAVTASKISVWNLEAISADLWNIVAWTITWVTITAWDTSGQAIILNPNLKRIDFISWWDNVWYIFWWSISWEWAIRVSADYFWMTSWTAVFGWKLKIPVWTNLY